jgi:tetratricopeptide (TPR) repeat protein
VNTSSNSRRPRAKQAQSDSAPSGARPRWPILALLTIICLAVGLSLWWTRGHSPNGSLPEEPIADSAHKQGDARATDERAGIPQSLDTGTAGQLGQVARLKQRAIDAARQLVDRYPDQAYVWHVLGRVEYDLGHTAEAVQHWKRALELVPEFAPSSLQLAVVAKDRAEYDEAAKWYERALQSAPDMFEARFGLAEARFNLGDGQAALKLLELDQRNDAAEAGPAFLLAGQIEVELQHYEQAKKYLQRAIEIIPRAPAPYHSLAIACARLGDVEQAARCRQEFRKRKQDVVKARGEVQGVEADLVAVRDAVARLLLLIGEAYEQFGDAAAAEQQWLEASQLAPNYTPARESLVLFYQKNRRLNDAAKTLEELCTLKPENASYQFAWGRVLAELRRFDEARTALAEAVRLVPTNDQYRQYFEQFKTVHP